MKLKWTKEKPKSEGWYWMKKQWVTVAFVENINGNSSILGNPESLHQLLINLLSNAVKYTPWEGEIKIHADDKTDRTQIAISDTGKTGRFDQEGGKSPVINFI